MRIRFERTVTRFPSGVAPVAVFFVALVLHYILLSVATQKLDLCPFRAVTGMKCPMCGLSSAYFGISRGEVLSGVLHNPLMVVVSLLLIVYLALPVAFRLTVKVILSPRERIIYSLALLVLFIANWLVFVL